MSSVLPRHELTVVEWPNPRARRGRGALERVVISASQPSAAVRSQSVQSGLDRLAAGAARTVIAGLDRHVRFDSQGRAQSCFGKVIYHYTRFSIDALYNRAGLADELVSLALRALSESHVDLVVAHSFGGTIALRAAWALQGQRAQFALITLGTASGYTVERAPMFAPFLGPHGIERPHQIKSWKHFYSLSDALVGSGQMPRSFLGIDIQRVHTGPFLQRGFGHALSGYLAAPRVRSAIVDGILLDTAAVRPADAEPVRSL